MSLEADLAYHRKDLGFWVDAQQQARAEGIPVDYSDFIDAARFMIDDIQTSIEVQNKGFWGYTFDFG